VQQLSFGLGNQQHAILGSWDLLAPLRPSARFDSPLRDGLKPKAQDSAECPLESVIRTCDSTQIELGRPIFGVATQNRSTVFELVSQAALPGRFPVS